MSGSARVLPLVYLWCADFNVGRNEKASATLRRMTDAIVRVPHMVQVRYQASLPALTYALHVYHRLSDSSSALDEEAAGYTS